MKGLWIALAVIVVVLVGAFLMMRSSATPEGTELPLETATATPLTNLETSVTPPATSTPSAASPAVAATTVTLSATSVTPATVTVPVGGSVTFTNADTVGKQISSDPHPTHTIYPALNGATIAPGASRTVMFTQAGTFGYHDHLNPSMTGTVIVQ